MASLLDDFLESAGFWWPSYDNTEVTIVGVVGKDSRDFRKSDIVNEFCFNLAFSEKRVAKAGNFYIEAFYHTKESIVFLVLYGESDFSNLYNLFMHNDASKSNSLLKNSEEREVDEASLLHIIFILSHVVLVVEQGRCIDATLLRTFERVNRLRMEHRSNISNALNQSEDLPELWPSFGRISIPVLCFMLPELCLRSEMSYNRRVEASEKMAASWESQIKTCLRHSKVVDAGSSLSLATFGGGNPHVFVRVKAKEERDEVVGDLVAHFIRGEGPLVADEVDHDFIAFLKCHIKDSGFVRGKQSKDQLPTLRQFVTGTRIVMSRVYGALSTDTSKAFLSAFADRYSIDLTKYAQAVELYSRACKVRGWMAEDEHEFELEKCLRQGGIDDEKSEILNDVKAYCEELWQREHCRCGAISVTGRLCKRAASHDTHDLPHTTGHRVVSKCNCGQSHAWRSDPFSLREANYEFYSSFSCCSKLDRFDFKVFCPVDGFLSREALVLYESSSATTTASSSFPTLARKSSTTSTKGGDITLSENMLGDQDVEEDDEDAEDDDDDEEALDVCFNRFLDDRQLKEIIENAVGDETAATQSDVGDEESITVDKGGYMEADTCDVKPASIVVSTLPYETLLQRYKGLFIEHVPHSNDPPDLLPAFPSWALLVIGKSNRYSHHNGIKLSNSRNRRDFLLACHFYIDVDTQEWEEDMKVLQSLTPRIQKLALSKKPPLAASRDVMSHEKLKFFFGFEYECPYDHRFFTLAPGRANVHHRHAETPDETVSNMLMVDQPVWIPCTCRKAPRVAAQLMRIHIVTPKAPISTVISPRIAFDECAGVFRPQFEPLHLSANAYYILRLPYAYVTSSGTPIAHPTTNTTKGRLVGDWVSVVHTRSQGLSSLSK